MHKMDQTRRRAPTSYAESEPPPPTRSPFATPHNAQIIDLEEEDEIAYTPSRAGLRNPKPNKSLKAMENAYVSPKRSRTKKRTALEELMGSEPLLLPPLEPILTARSQIRQEIAVKTVAARDQFLIEKKDLWLPLLPPGHNYIEKILAKHNELSAEEIAKLPTITPYEEIETQPKGITATMKPYQLSGLSFMMYLHRNVSDLSFGLPLLRLLIFRSRVFLVFLEMRWDLVKLSKPCHSFNT